MIRLFMILTIVASTLNTCYPVEDPPTGTTHKQWEVLRHCEATGNYKAVNPSGKYRGAYQMDKSFWVTYGGDPAYLPRFENAPKEHQDSVAYRGYRARGWQPWPHCGRKARRS